MWCDVDFFILWSSVMNALFSICLEAEEKRGEKWARAERERERESLFEKWCLNW